MQILQRCGTGKGNWLNEMSHKILAQGQTVGSLEMKFWRQLNRLFMLLQLDFGHFWDLLVSGSLSWDLSASGYEMTYLKCGS